MMILRLDIKRVKAKYLYIYTHACSQPFPQLHEWWVHALQSYCCISTWSQCQSCTLDCSAQIPENENFNKLGASTLSHTNI